MSKVGLFRPLTKVMYFQVTYGLFGLNPFPYHVLSLIFHALNIFLFFLLMRRLNIGAIPALVTSSIFALHTGFFDVIAWISCIQQLMGETFMLLGLLCGIKAYETRRPILVITTMLIFVLALMSMEQTYALPLILLVYVFLEQKKGRLQTRAGRAIGQTLPYLAVMTIFLIFVLGWKGVPEEGPYRYHFGANVITNLLTYLDWSLGVSVVMPFVVDVQNTGLTATHLVIILLIVYNIAKRRERLVVLGTAFYLLTILPVLFLEKHTFYLHNYIPSFGILLLAAPVVEDFYNLLKNRYLRATPVIVVVLVGVVTVMCFTKVRKNETNYLRRNMPLPKNFVLRKAIVAKNVYDDINSKAPPNKRTQNLFMIYQGIRGWYEKNVLAALSNDSALKLFYSDPNLNVFFRERGDTLLNYNPANSQMLFFDHMGHCFTQSEIERLEGATIQMLESD